MSTTVLFVEQIIVGFQGALWIVLFVTAIIGSEKIPAWLRDPKNWSTPVAIIVVIYLYSLGVVLDRVFQGLAELIDFEKMLSRIKFIKTFSNAAHDNDLVKVYAKVGILTPYFQYVVGRTRISRATMFNFPLIAFGLILNLDWSSHRILILLVLLSLVIFTPLCVFTYASFLETLETRGRQVLENPDIKIGL